MWADLVASASPLVVAGFSSIASLVDLVAAWDSRAGIGQARVLLGTEPFASNRVSFASRAAAFTDEVRRYWLEQEGISLRLSAKVVQVIAAVDAGRLDVAYIPGRQRLHAKVYVGQDAAMMGSSNFTDAGLGVPDRGQRALRTSFRPAPLRRGGDGRGEFVARGPTVEHRIPRLVGRVVAVRVVAGGAREGLR